MVADPATVWLGLEYFCNESDELWKMSDERMVALAKEELSKIGIIDAAEVMDATVLRMEKTYPAYFGTYDRFAEIREHVDRYTESISDRPQRHAPLQQPGPLHADGHDGRGRYYRRQHGQVAPLGSEYGDGLSRRGRECYVSGAPGRRLKRLHPPGSTVNEEISQTANQDGIRESIEE